VRHTPTVRTQLAGRIEAVNVAGTAVTFPGGFLPPPDDPPGAQANLNYLPKSISFSMIKDLPWALAASLNLQRIERAPRAVELFSRGPHDATQTFDIGNPGLKIETGNSVEIGLKRTEGSFRFDGKAYYTRYDNFIFQQPTGNSCDDTFATCAPGTAGAFLQTFYGQRDAIFRGAELAWHWDVTSLANGTFGVDGQFDTVKANFTDGSNVPRMPPMRVGGGAYWRNDNWFARVGLIHAFAQTNFAEFDTPTAGYNLLKMEIAHRRYWQYSPWGPIEVTTGVVGDNLLDADIRNSTQFHKDEILLPGRTFKLFVNVKYGAQQVSNLPPGFTKAPWRNGAGSSGYWGGPELFAKAPILRWSWDGLYAGGNLGYGFGRAITDTWWNDAATQDPLFGTSVSSPLDNAIFGVGAGYNWRSGPWVVAGIEGDAQLARQRGSVATVCPGAVCNAALAPLGAPVNVSFAHRLDWFATLRGRLGVTPMPDLLAYVTAGVAIGGIKLNGVTSGFDAAGNAVITGFQNELTQVGWALGAGLEGHLVGNWTGKIEYLRMDFGSAAAYPVPSGATVATALNTRIADNIVRVGVNYRFDRNGAHKLGGL
jgi:iron complex outermembrane receptor protein